MDNLSTNTEVVWLFIDPVRRKVDFYPKPISERIEKSFNEQSNDIVKRVIKTCILGQDFF